MTTTTPLAQANERLRIARESGDLDAVSSAMRTLTEECAAVDRFIKAERLARVTSDLLRRDKHCATCTCGDDPAVNLDLTQEISRANTPSQVPGAIALDNGDRDRWLIPWTPENDHRPKRGASSPTGGGAKHGDCTSCRKGDWGGSAGVGTAKYRVVNRMWTTDRSLCDRCARKLVHLPRSVPQFDDAAAAQEWLDKLTDELVGNG